jgi:hypothetical protein
MTQIPGACTIKLFTAVIYGFCNKLECLSLTRLSSLAQYFLVRSGAYLKVDHLKGASLR